ncbi:tryptophanase [Mycobacterium sp. TY813]|uniref:tryptophanase n=2 Tax=Mycobacteriaceae TaxID=1762 RepID=UPI0027405E82|nr:tryptophanase [Mycobacterium sp. TY813]MDP7733094.1 tryptophanase [Mycobacterium sp. TY813]
MDSDAGMAWLLADAAEPCLTGDQRTMVFVELGGGENHLAIERILRVVVADGFPLSIAVLAALTEWLDLYVGSPEERLLRGLVSQVRAQGPDLLTRTAY